MTTKEYITWFHINQLFFWLRSERLDRMIVSRRWLLVEVELERPWDGVGQSAGYLWKRSTVETRTARLAVRQTGRKSLTMQTKQVRYDSHLLPDASTVTVLHKLTNLPPPFYIRVYLMFSCPVHGKSRTANRVCKICSARVFRNPTNEQNNHLEVLIVSHPESKPLSIGPLPMGQHRNVRNLNGGSFNNMGLTIQLLRWNEPSTYFCLRLVTEI